MSETEKTEQSAPAEQPVPAPLAAPDVAPEPEQPVPAPLAAPDVAPEPELPPPVPAPLDTSVGAVGKRLTQSPQQAKVDEAVRQAHEEHEARAAERGELLKQTASATGNAFARQGLNVNDIERAVGMLRLGSSFEQVKFHMRDVAAPVLDAWQDELERLSELPPGGEPILLSSPKK